MIFFLPLHKFFTMARHYNNKYKKKNQEINFIAYWTAYVTPDKKESE